MKKRYFPVVLALFLAVPGGLAAQNGDFTPFVSHIRAESRNNLIRLTWLDSPDARGPVYIFRSTRPFAGTIPPNIRPVVVRYGAQYYIDDTDDLDNLYYFIAASDVSGRRYDIIIPQTNSANVNLASGEQSVFEAPPQATAEPIKGISNLRASLDGERVIITFNVSDPRRNAVLYRSMQPVRRPQDLLNAVVVQSGVDSPFVDFPVSGLSWYYAAVFEDEISGGNVGISPGINATTSAVLISGSRAAQKTLRPIPLPVMTLRNAMGDGFLLPDTIVQIPLTAEIEKLLRNTPIQPKGPLTLKRPRVFAVDMQAPSSGEDSALFQIVREFFVKRDWEGARVSLLHYLSLPRSKDVEARARFYLGQTLYFTEDYRGALFEFLSIRPVHTVEANIWIEAILTAMVH